MTRQPRPSHCSPLLQGTRSRTGTLRIHQSPCRRHWAMLFILLMCLLLIFLESDAVQMLLLLLEVLLDFLPFFFSFSSCFLFFILFLFSPLSVPYCSCLLYHTDAHLCPTAPTQPLTSSGGGTPYVTDASQLSWVAQLLHAVPFLMFPAFSAHW